jgi:hypothetical protein
MGPTKSCGYLLLCSTLLSVGDVKYTAWREEASPRETAGWHILLQDRHLLEREQVDDSNNMKVLSEGMHLSHSSV